MPSFQVDVAVEPDASRFSEKLRADLTAAEAKQKPFGVPLTPDATGFAKEASAKVKVALADLDARVRLSPELSASFRRDVERLAKTALAGATVPVTVVPQLSRTFRTDLAREVKRVTAGTDIEIPVQAKLASGFRTRLQAAIRALRPVDVEVAMSVDRRSFATFTADLVRRASVAGDVASQAAQIRPAADLTRFGADLAAGVAADVAAVSRTDAADVAVGVDARTFAVDLAGSVTEATRAVSSSDVADVTVGVDMGSFDADLLAEVGAATLAAGLSDAGSVEIRPDTTGFTAGLAAEVGAATTAISASEAASIEIRADTGAAAAQIGAVGAASTEAAASAGLLAGAAKGAVIGVAGVGVAAGAAAVGLFKVGSSFDDAFDKIQVQTGAIGETLAGLEQSFRDVAAVVPSSFDDISTAIADVNQRLGLTGDELETVASQILDLSRITGTDLTANLENAAGALQSFSVPVEDISSSLDFLFRASQDSGVAVDALAASLKTSGAALRTAGFDFEESAALIAQLTKAGIPAESVLQSLSIAARKLAAAGKDPAEGIADLVEQIKAAKSPTDALAIATATFGRGAVGITDAIRSGKFDLAAFFDQVKSGKATIEGTARTTDDAAESFKTLTNNLKLVLEKPAAAFFQKITDVAKDLVPQLEAMTPAIGAIVGGLGDVAISIVEAIVPVLQGLVPALAPIAAAIADTFAGLAPILETLADGFGALFAAVSPALVGLIRSAGDVLGDIADVVRTNLAPFMPGLIDAVENLADAFGGLLEAALKVLPPIADIVSSLLAPPVLIALTALADGIAAVTRVLTPFAGALTAAFIAYKAFTGIRALTGIIQGLSGAFLGLIRGVGPALEGFRLGLQGVTDASAGMANGLGSAVAKVGGLPIALTGITAAIGLIVLGWTAWKLDADKKKKEAAEIERSIKGIADEALRTGKTAEQVFRATGLRTFFAENRETFKQLGISITDVDKALQGSVPQFEAFLDTLGDLSLEGKISYGDVGRLADALRGARHEAQGSVRDTKAQADELKALGLKADGTAIATKGLTDATKKLTPAQLDSNQALRDWRKAQENIPSATEAANKALLNWRKATEKTKKAMDDLKTAIDGVIDKAFALEGGTDAIQSSLNQLPTLIFDLVAGGTALGDVLTATSDEAIAFRSGLRDLVGGGKDLIDVWIDQGVKGTELKDKVAVLSQSLQDQAVAMGVPREAAKKYTDVLLDIPTGVKTVIEADTSSALPKIDEVVNKLFGIDTTTTTATVDANTTEAHNKLRLLTGEIIGVPDLVIEAHLDDRPLQLALDRMRRGIIGGGSIGFRPGFSTGGHVPGPRVSADVVPAMLTPGEVVIRKVMVDRFGLDELLALNRGVVPPGWVVPRRFAEGGEVPDVAAQAGRFLASVAPQMPLSSPWTVSQSWAGAVPPSVEVAAYTAMLHEAGQAQRIVELAAAPSVSERARQVAHSLSVEFGARPAERTAGDEAPVGEAVKASLDRFEERSLAILAAALDQRPLVGSLTVQGKGDGRRDAATIVRELAGARWRMGV